MSTSHTPGPWEHWGGAQSNYGITGPSAAATGVAAMAVRDCRITNSATPIQIAAKNKVAPALAFGDTPDEAKANARLIAAAPDLLEAAKMVIAWYEAEDDHSKADFYERMQMCRDSESALRAAIAKATGAQS